jgi:uncharacterized repeat protein (TIGR01451 family)
MMAAVLYVVGAVDPLDQHAVKAAETTCPSPTALVNGDFESPLIADGSTTTVPASATGWKSGSTPVELSRDNGHQHAQLTDGLLYQDVRTEPGRPLRWELKHRAGTLTVLAGPPTGPLTPLGDDITDGGTYGGDYTVPEGRTTTRFALQATGPSLVDGVFFGSAACLITETAVSSETAKVNDVLTYVVTARNDGGYPARRVQIDGQVPAGTTLISGKTRKRVDILRPGESRSLTYRVRVDRDSAAKTVGVAATAEYAGELSGFGERLTSVSDEASTEIAAAADLSVTAEPTTVRDDVSGYAITVSNKGPDTADDVRVRTVLPDEMTAVAATSPQGTCTVTSSVAECAYPDLPAGEDRSMSVETVGTSGPPSARARATGLDAGIHTEHDADAASGSVTAISDTDEINPADNAAATPGADDALAADFQLNGPGDSEALVAGEQFTGTVVVTDPTGEAAPAEVRYGVRAGETIPEADAGPGTCDFLGSGTPGSESPTGGVYLCRLDAVHADWEITFTGSVPADYADRTFTRDVLVGTATVTAVAPVERHHDLMIDQTTTTHSVERNGTVRFRAAMRNDGPSSATITVNVEPGEGLAITSGTSEWGDYSNGRWTVADLPPYRSAQIDLTGIALAEGSLSNTIQIEGRRKTVTIESTPSSEATVSPANSSTPPSADDTTAPGDDTTPSAGDTTTPGESSTPPTDSTEEQAGRPSTPTDGTEEQAGSPSTPTDDTEEQAGSPSTPTHSTEAPGGSTDAPGTSTDAPVGSTSAPADNIPSGGSAIPPAPRPTKPVADGPVLGPEGIPDVTSRQGAAAPAEAVAPAPAAPAPTAKAPIPGAAPKLNATLPPTPDPSVPNPTPLVVTPPAAIVPERAHVWADALPEPAPPISGSALASLGVLGLALLTGGLIVLASVRGRWWPKKTRQS